MDTTQDILRRHWRQYLMEAAGLAVFISSACVVTTLVEFPGSPVRQAVGDPILRRVLIGIWMGLTIAAFAYSPWGQKTGAHINPAVTWAFHRVGKIKTCDAVCYTLAQFAGAAAGITVMAALLSRWIGSKAVNFVVTEPGPMGTMPKFSPYVAFAGEFVISFPADVRSPASDRRQKDRKTGGGVYRRSDLAVHHRRVAAVRHESEPGTLVRFGAGGAFLDRAVGISNCADAGDAAGGGVVSPKKPTS